MSKIRVYIVFDDPICSKGSIGDGQFLRDLIYLEKTGDFGSSLLLDTVPRVGETIELWSSAGGLYFTVIAVHYFAVGNLFQSVKILLTQIPFRGIPSHYWTQR